MRPAPEHLPASLRRAERGARESPARPHQSEKVGALPRRRESTKRFRRKELNGRSKWPFAEAASKLDQCGSPARPAPLRLPPVPAQSETATETSVGRPSPRLPYRTRATIPRGYSEATARPRRRAQLSPTHGSPADPPRTAGAQGRARLASAPAGDSARNSVSPLPLLLLLPLAPTHHPGRPAPGHAHQRQAGAGGPRPRARPAHLLHPARAPGCSGWSLAATCRGRRKGEEDAGEEACCGRPLPQ